MVQAISTMPRARARLGSHWRCSNPSTTAGGNRSFATPLKRSSNTGRIVMIHPAHSSFFEAGAVAFSPCIGRSSLTPVIAWLPARCFHDLLDGCESLVKLAAEHRFHSHDKAH